jgi:NADH-quinone oxidoreductase subunit G
MDFPRRTFDGEGVKADVDFGPTLMLNRNRCIMCTRCERFMREVDGDAQIGIVDRGNHSEIATFEERGVHSLMSGNLMDVCPVGALTTRDYRFKSRPWDNPLAVDTICTSCSKGCNTTAWIKAKPEWAKGAQLIRLTPRFNPDVNGYWMCDIGRFGYHWLEADTRLSAPLSQDASGRQGVVSWTSAYAKVKAAVADAGGALRVLASAHCSTEELFLTRELVTRLGQSADTIAVAWTTSKKAQPAHATFVVSDVDAPNVAGARDLGLALPALPSGAADLGALKSAVDSGRIKVVYVVDPGPAGSIGEVGWLVQARLSGVLPFLAVQAVEPSPLTAAADVVLPGAAWAEKDGLFTNDQGRVQTTARVMTAPGDARDDSRILTELAGLLGVPFTWPTTAAVRAAVETALAAHPAYAGVKDLAAAGPVPARTWLQASNPSERWKWDHAFQDNPPVKGEPALVRGALEHLLKK